MGFFPALFCILPNKHVLLLELTKEIFIEDTKDSTRKLLELINKFSKVAGYKINIQKSVAFYTPIVNSQREIKKTIPFTITSKKKIPRNKFNQGCKKPVLGKVIRH